MLDEPLSSLDASAQAQVANLLLQLSRELHIAMLLISHDLAIVRQVADRISVMYLGVIVETGPTKPVWARPLHPYTEALINAVPARGRRRHQAGAAAGRGPGPGAAAERAAASTRAAPMPSTAAGHADTRARRGRARAAIRRVLAADAGRARDAARRRRRRPPAAADAP